MTHDDIALLERIMHVANSVQVGYLVVFAIALPFALPLFFRLGRIFWAHGGLGTKLLAICVVAIPAAIAGLVAGLALLGEYEHFFKSYPGAFGPAVTVGIGLAVLLIVAEFIVGATTDRRQTAMGSDPGPDPIRD